MEGLTCLGVMGIVVLRRCWQDSVVDKANTTTGIDTEDATEKPCHVAPVWLSSHKGVDPLILGLPPRLRKGAVEIH